MKKNLSLLIFAAATLAFSCSKELAEPVKEDNGTLASQTFTANREDMIDNATKATFDRGIQWQVNDEIAVSDGTTQSVFVATAVDESGNATFALKAGQTPLATTGVTYKAWYPTSIAPDANGVMRRPQLEKNLNGAIPSGKTANYSPNIYATNPMYAESTTTTLSFKNLCGLLKITYTGEGILMYRNIFESYTQPVWGPYTIVDNKMVLSGDANTNGRAELQNTNSKYVSYGGVDYIKTYYYAIPEGTYNTLAIVPITTTPLCQVKGLKDGQSLTVERNKVYALDINLNDLRTDLSREVRTANCYAFAGAGNYMFRATRGNEKEVISGIDHVDILWKAQAYDTQSLKSAVVTNLTYKNGYVLFTGPGNQANAVIAAYDASGNILWSWHIWSLNSARPLTDVTVNGVTMLDRNLGALYADKYTSGGKATSIWTSGYLYQWGRKDPFPGRGQEGSAIALIKMFDKDDNILGTYSSETDLRIVAHPILTGPVTVETSIKNPEKFIAPTTAIHWASDIADTWGGDTKTIYDPCPYGYRVPASSVFTSSWKEANFTPCVEANSAGNTAYHGFYYKDSSNKTFFPITGMFGWNNGKIQGAYLGSNTSTTSSAVETYGRMWTRDSNHTFLQVRGVVDQNKTMDNRRNTFAPTSDNYRAYGMAVRCVKE